MGLLSLSLFGDTVSVTADEEVEWINHVMPLPHEISIKNKIIMHSSDIGIKLYGSNSIETNAISIFKDFYRKKTGTDGDGTVFEIIVGTVDNEAIKEFAEQEIIEKLKKLPNHDQAYFIQPCGKNKLLVTAIDPKGIFYGIQTLCQLLAHKTDPNTVAVPMVKIIDWPDLDQRGVWNTGYETPGYISWLSSMKLNFSHIQTGLILKKGEKARSSKLPMALIKEAHNNAFMLMPHIPHFDYFCNYGSDSVYPELAGKGQGALNPYIAIYSDLDKFKGKNYRAPCMATPLLKRIITEWIEDIAEQGIREFGLWLTEFTPCQCECAECLKEGHKQYQKETKACVDAINEVRSKYPDLTGRIFFTLNSTEKDTCDSYECLALVPPDIRIEKVYGRNKAFDEYAAKGRWIAIYTGPQPVLLPGGVIRYATEDAMKKASLSLLNAKYSGMYCLGKFYAAPSQKKGIWEKAFGSYQYSALAEWTWNAGGRTPRQFNTAWASINQINKPELFADWIEVTRSAKDYVLQEGSRKKEWINAASKLKDAGFIEDWFKKRPSEENMKKMIEDCDMALSLARQINDRSVILETMYIKMFLSAQLSFRNLFNCMNGPGADREKTTERIKDFSSKIDELWHATDELLSVPAVIPESGPELIKKQELRWTENMQKSLKLPDVHENRTVESGKN